ncbi:hypothetical protein ADU59_25295 [Pararhizobium polonicum]|uniref:Uncharacterized protein n=1 Tax=Pararhizobium polonicum TaxID=1612624 RepID=A0A1C7NUR1_9HYPH|nr:hypothetical protein [Pararhizobium polonicum]OBZ92702.1 hypothetical protein ADU59_25295 [Pararhizobium polonicum]
MLQTCNPSRTQVLLCLPDPDAATALTAFLTEYGFAVTTIWRLSELTEAVTLGSYTAVVTVTALVGPIRRLSPLPVVNVETYLDAHMLAGSIAEMAGTAARQQRFE